ncbi:uncharacterized protein LOC126660153 [Mercurialis annua]|uniref:uncharacterized protein LOC126660153 n=1 Tax=Mercurialis annua TaxID=3986 RepID=UPI002160EE45|nr:uncharacterized protein LOC126660153 [Mercurialis annua]
MSNPRRTVRNWSELDSDLLSEIADRINCLRDFIIFGAVCRSWRSVASPENFNKTTKAPWLLLDQDKDDHSSRKFLDLSNDIIYRMNLPKYDYTQFDLWKYSVRSSIREKHYVYSSKGWFLNVENHLRLSLLNPFSLSTIDLPHLESKVLLNFALSSSPSAASDFMILIAYYASAMRDIKLSFWKNGDRKWTDLDLKFCISDLNITYHNGRFYIVDGVEFGETFVVHEIDIQNPQSVLISSKSFPDSYPSTRIHYPFWIVESSRVLMKVSWRLNYVSSDVRAIITDDFYSHVPHFQFIVEEINFEKGECKKWKRWCLQHDGWIIRAVFH